MSMILALANQKGGCGKTTSAVHLAACLAQIDYRVLLVDLDPQGHAGIGLGCTGTAASAGLADLLLRSEPPAAEDLAAAVRPARQRLDLLPSSISLAGFEPQAAGIEGRERRLTRLLDAGHQRWDVVVVDCPPNLGPLTVNALLAAQLVLVPFEGSPFALQAARRLEQTLGALEQATGHGVRSLLLPTMVAARDRFGADLRAELRRQRPGGILGEGIRRSVLFPRAAAAGKTVEELSPNSGAAADYRVAARLLVREWDRQRWRERAQFEGLRREGDVYVFTHPRLEPEQVLLAGEFNGWVPDAGVRLEATAEGGWRKVVALAPGRWEYKFVIRDEWHADPCNPREIPNPQGTTNSLLEVQQPASPPAASSPPRRATPSRALSIAAERQAKAAERHADRLLVSRSHRYIRPSTR